MPKPAPNTATEIIICTLEAIPAWFNEYQKTLFLELDDDENGATLANELASILRTKEEGLIRERKEDKEATTERYDLLENFRYFERSIRSSVKRRTKKDKNQIRIFQDFQFGPTSRVRGVRDANERIRQIRSSIDVHRETLNQGRDRTQRWLDRLSDFESKLKQQADKQIQERKETGEIQEERDQVRDQALDFLDDMELAAQAISDVSTEPIKALKRLFESTNPSNPKKTPEATPEVPTNPTTPSPNPTETPVAS